MDDFNPYAAPSADITAPNPIEGEVWREGDLLVMTRDAKLPMRCLRCNRPTSWTLRRTLMCHPGYWYLLVFINIVLYVLVAMLVRKTAKIDVPLCEPHRQRRRKLIAIAWLLALTGIAGVVLAVPGWKTSISGPLTIGGVVTFVASLIVALFASQVVAVEKIDKRLVWLKKINPDYLAALPAWGE